MTTARRNIVLRCRFSDEGKRWLNPQNPDRLGYMKENTRNSQLCTVLWDGRKSANSYARRFIDICEERVD